jgi:hypothetical protein
MIEIAQIRYSPLEVSDSLAELLSLVRIGDGLVKRSLGETDHLGGDTDSTFVEDINGNLEAKRLKLNLKEAPGIRRTLYPLPISPTMFSLGTLTSSKLSKQVEDALIPSCRRAISASKI